MVAVHEHIKFKDSEGQKSWYHLWESGQAGFLYYFDGDYTDLDETSINWPREGLLAQLASVAQRHDLMLVAVNTPDTDGSGDGYTWWEDIDSNGDYFRELHADLCAKYPLVDASNLWLVGYSGGAEFISYDLLNRGIKGMTTGGAVIVGGGGAEGRVAKKKRAQACAASVPMHWCVGDRDVVGATNPPEWSALHAARDGAAAFSEAGFSTHLHIFPGVDHAGYDIPTYVEHCLSGTADQLGSSSPVRSVQDLTSKAAGWLRNNWRNLL